MKLKLERGEWITIELPHGEILNVEATADHASVIKSSGMIIYSEIYPAEVKKSPRFSPASEEDMAAKREGWAIFDVDGVPQIQRLDVPNASDPSFPEEPVFADDASALSYVAGRAAGGSKLHRDALEIHFGRAVDAVLLRALSGK